MYKPVMQGLENFERKKKSPLAELKSKLYEKEKTGKSFSYYSNEPIMPSQSHSYLHSLNQHSKEDSLPEEEFGNRNGIFYRSGSIKDARSYLPYYQSGDIIPYHIAHDFFHLTHYGYGNPLMDDYPSKYKYGQILNFLGPQRRKYYL